MMVARDADLLLQETDMPKFRVRPRMKRASRTLWKRIATGDSSVPRRVVVGYGFSAQARR